MKKTLLLFILLIPLTLFAQSKKSIDGFLEIPFGSDSATVKNVFLSKGATEDYPSNKKDIIVFRNFIFSDRYVFSCVIKFVDNKVFEAVFLFSDFAEKDILGYYDNISADITSIYGIGQVNNNFRSSENNSTRIGRLISEREFCKTIWQSKNNNAMTLDFESVDNSLIIRLVYEDDDLINKSPAKIKSDF